MPRIDNVQPRCREVVDLLARRLFGTMAKYGPKLEKEQVVLGNFVDIGVELFVMTATLSYTDYLVGQNPADQSQPDTHARPPGGRRAWKSRSSGVP